MSRAANSTGSGPDARFPLGLFALGGALGALFIGLNDFGASWLWLPLWRDRGGLLLRNVALLAPAGAAAGYLLVTLYSASRALFAGRPRHRRWLAPLLLTLPVLWPLYSLAVRLLSGGAMSRLPHHATLVVTVAAVGSLVVYAALVVLPALAAWVVGQPERTRRSAWLLFVLAFGLGKLNQLLLPNLYDYLHALLALGSWFVAGAASVLAIAAYDVPRRFLVRVASSRRAIAILGGALLGLGSFTLATLNGNLNVRVALFDAKSPSTRALLTSVDPVLAWLERRDRGHGGKGGLGRRVSDTAGLPTQKGAHVLLITVDALRADHLGAYGYRRPVSPGLDRLAAEGVQFERAYAQAPHSSYSLSSLHTSSYVHELVELSRPLPEPTLASVLKANGYHTAAFFTDGIFHTEGAKLKPYRDEAFQFALFDHTNRESEDQTDRVLQEVDRIRALGEPPSFLWVHYFDVHEPYQETFFGSDEMDRYDSEIRHVDRELSRLVAELEKRFDREVIVAISADHGEEFRDHGGVYHGSTLYDEQVRVPLLLRAAALPPRKVQPPVEVIDIAPTLLGLLGLPPPPTMQGRDLRALALAKVDDPGPVFSAVLTKRMALRWPFKLIADLRFGLFELYDLAHDPQERKNLANHDPIRLAELRGLVYGWLDAVHRDDLAAASAPAPYERELSWGRLGDRRAVQPMMKLLLDRSAPTPQRLEAGQILARLADESSASALVAGLTTEPFEVSAEAAIALGRMYDERARAALEKLIYVEDPYLRARAAVSLGRLRDRQAVPALIDALWVAPTQYEREESVRWLGRLRDRRAVEPLLAVLPEFALRHLVAAALGYIGDPRSFAALSDMLDWEHHTNVRDEVVRGLGLLGDARAIEPLVEVLRREPELKNTSEALVRLGALEAGYLGGFDFGPAHLVSPDLGRCTAGPLFHDWDFQGRTSCETLSSTLRLMLPVPSAHADWRDGAMLVLRARRLDAPDPVEVEIEAGGEHHALRVDGSFSEQRLLLGAQRSRRLPLTLSAAEGARLLLDHVLLLPHVSAASPRNGG